jgi:glycerate kinase
MKILIAPDSFKNALSSTEVAESIKRGLTKNSNHEIKIQQLSDGGEGALNVILENPLFESVSLGVSNPLGKLITSSYAINKTENTAFIEIAQAAGLELLNPNEKNPLHTTTFGVGQTILDAYKKGIRNFTLSLGGSATNDGGAGLLSALGVEFIGVKPKLITNSALTHITEIIADNIKIKKCKFKILVDVDNPLLGENGATNIFAPQKGAKKEDLKLLESNLSHFAKIVSRKTNTDYTNLRGSGAAGGIAFGLKSFFDTEIVSGISELMKFCKLEEKIKNSNLIISGEGSLDSQSQNGKLLSGITEMCYKHNKPFILVAGKVENISLEYFFNKGCKAIIPIQDKKQTIEQSMARTSEMLEKTGLTISEFI